MNTHDRAVDHLNLAVVGLHDGVHQLVPDARLSPTIEAIVDCRIRAVAFGQIAPRRAGPQNVEHTVEDLPVVLRLRPAPSHRHQRLDDTPFEVREIVTPHDPSSDVWKHESMFESRV